MQRANPQAENPEKMEPPRLSDHDLVHELSRRLQALCRYAQCITDAEGDTKMQQTWRELELQELSDIQKLKQMIKARVQTGEFLQDLD